MFGNISDFISYIRYGYTTVRFHPVDVVPATAIGAKSKVKFVPDSRVIPGFLEVWDGKLKLRSFQQLKEPEGKVVVIRDDN